MGFRAGVFGSDNPSCEALLGFVMRLENNENMQDVCSASPFSLELRSTVCVEPCTIFSTNH